MALQDLISKARKTKLYKAIDNVVRDSGRSINNQVQQRIGQPVRQWANNAYNEARPRTNLEFASAPFMKMTGSSALQQRQDLIDQRNRGLNLSQRLFRPTQQDENQLLGEGIRKGAKTVGTVGIPAYKGLAVANAGIGYGLSRLMGADNKQALGAGLEAAQYAPIIGQFAKATNPIINRQLNKLPVKTPQFIQNRIAPTLANVGQGIGMDVATGRPTDALSLGLDAVMGAIGGKGQFSSVRPNAKGIQTTKQGAKNVLKEESKIVELISRYNSQFGQGTPDKADIKLVDEATETWHRIHGRNKKAPRYLSEIIGDLYQAREGILAEELMKREGLVLGFAGKAKTPQPTKGVDPLLEEAAQGIKNVDVKDVVEDVVDDIVETAQKSKSTLKISNKDIENINEAGEEVMVRLSDLIDIPDLYKKYPELKDFPVHIKWKPGQGASTNFKEIIINPSTADFKENLIHELQHVVQNIEGMPTGGGIEKIGKEAFEEYQNLPGEIQAREASKLGEIIFNKATKGVEAGGATQTKGETYTKGIREAYTNQATDLTKNQGRLDTDRSLSQSPAQLAGGRVQTQKTKTQPKIKTKPSRTTNTQTSDYRTSVASEGSITGNPVKDDITGVNPTGITSRIREAVQDNWIRVKNLQRQKGVKVDESSDPYLAEELYHGRVATRIEDVKQQVINYDNDVLETSKKLNIPDKKVKNLVNTYLQAKHAPERNKVHGDGAAGMTNAQSTKILSDISSSKYGEEIARLSKQVQDLNNQTIDILYNSQVIDKKMYDTLRQTYKNHVPLNRVMNESDDITQVLVGKGFNVKGTGVKRAKGSQRQVADILTNVVTNLESAIVRAEKNRVNLATLNFARNNPQLGIFEVIKPKAIGQTFDGKIITQQVNDPLVLSVRENGKPVFLRIKDENLATVFQGIGNEKLPGALKFVQMFTGFYSGLHTRFNPEFAVSNVVRDVQEMVVFMASQKDVGFSGAAKTLTKEGSSAKHILDYMKGIDSEGAKLYRQMKLDGGTTGGMALSTRKNVEIDLKKIEQLNRSNPRKATQKVLESFDQWNTVFEDATRLSVYRQALDAGMSRKQAASLAKNSTVNFNKKGTNGPIINALYMFSNASIQGSVKMLRAMKNPKVAAATITAVGTATFAINNWNDQIDPDWREKVTDWDRNSNLVVMLPSDEGSKYITIPVSWGLKPIKVGADVSYDLATGNESDVVGAGIKIASSAFDAYNPAGGQDITSALTPTVLDTPVDISRNQSWSGASIKPDWMEGLPASEQKFKNTGETLSGQAAIGVADTLSNASIEVSPENILYAYEQYVGGLGKFTTRVAGTTTSLIKGEAPEAKEVPFTNRFYKSRSEEQVQSSVAYKKQDEFFESLKDFETGSQDQKEAIKNYLRQQASDKERQSTLFKLRDRGIDTKGISYSGKKLGVSNTPPQSDKVSFVDYEDQPSNILEKIALTANGMTKDPGNTVKAIFTQEELRKIEGNAVILKRQEFLNKSKDKNLQRDHIIPLGLGGDNSEANLVYVSKEYHAEKTKLDQKLIRQLQNGEITRQEAQDEVRAWVNANPTEHFVVETTETIGEKDVDSLPSKELENLYLSEALSMPKSNRYEKSQRDDELWSESGSIMNNEELSDEQKQSLQTKIAKELGVPEEDIATYQVAKQDNDTKTLYAYDRLDESKSFDEFMSFLTNGRRPVNGKILVSDGVIDNLVDDGVIPYSVGKEIKDIDLNADGSVKTSKGKVRATSSKYNKALLNIIKKQNQAQMDAFKALGNAKIRAYSSSSPSMSRSVQPIKTKNLTFSGAGY